MAMAWERLNIGIDKGQATIIALLVAVLPWLAGGQAAAGLATIYAATVVGLFLVWRLRYKVAAKPRLALVATLLVAWAAASVLWSPNHYQTVIAVVTLALLYGLFNVANQLSSKPKLVEAWLGGFLAMASFVSLYGYGLYMTGSYDRLTSIFTSAGPMAGFLLPVILVAGWRYMRGGGWFYGLITTINLAALILTDSHGATIILAVLSFVSLSVAKQRIDHWTRIVFVLVASLAVAVGLNAGRVKLADTASAWPGAATAAARASDSATLGDRLSQQRSILAIWSDHPIIGAGGGSFATLHPQYQYGVAAASGSAADVYLQSFAELGIVGGGLAVWLVVELLAGVWRGARHDPALWAPALGLVALLAHLAIDLDATFPAILALVAVLAGLLYRPKATKAAPARFGLLAIVALVAIVTLPIMSDYRSRILASDGQADAAAGAHETAARDYGQAHLQLTYDPEVLTLEGNERLALAAQGQDAALNLTEAGRRAAAAVKLDPESAAPYVLLARVDQASGQVAAAEGLYRQALVLDPYNHPEYYTELAALYLRDQKLTAALDLTNRVTQLYSPGVLAAHLSNPQLPVELSQAYTTQAGALVRLGRLPEAHIALERALELDSANTTAQQLEQSTGQ